MPSKKDWDSPLPLLEAALTPDSQLVGVGIFSLVLGKMEGSTVAVPLAEVAAGKLWATEGTSVEAAY